LIPNDDNSRLYKIYATPYEELYADTVAVYFESNPSALTHALYFNEMTQTEYDYIKFRDFSNSYAKKDADWMRDEHSRLSYVRSFIGKNMMPRNLSDARKFLSILENAIVQSLRIDFARKTELEVIPANDQLIKILSRELKVKN